MLNVNKWPKDTMAAKIAFYGDPRGKHGADPRWVEKNLVRVTPPFQMYYVGKPIKTITVHRKVQASVIYILEDIWENCGMDQKEVDRTGASDYAGCFNYRVIAGSNPPSLSNHSFACAIDLSPKTNGFGKGKGTIGSVVVEAFKREGWFWGGDYKNRTDPMHFEAVTR